MPDPGESTYSPRDVSWFWSAWAQYLLVAALGAMIVFVRLGATTLDDHEAKAALAARNMARRNPEWLVQGFSQEELPPCTPLNRFLIPINNGRPRLQKTPLGYWCMAGLGMLFGDREITELTARAPSALAGIFCALVTLLVGRRMFSPRVGLLGALMFTTSIAFQKLGRSARPEMLTSFLMTVAMMCFYFALIARARSRRAWWMIVFGVVMGLANLTKPFFPLLLGFPLLVYLFWESSLHREQAEQIPVGTARNLLIRYCIATACGIALSILATTVISMISWEFDKPSKTTVNMLVMAGLVCGPMVWYAIKTRGWGQMVPLLPGGTVGLVIMFALFVPWMWCMGKFFPLAGDFFDEQLSQRAAGTGKWTSAAPHYYFVPLLTLTLPWIGFVPGGFICPWLKRFSRHRRPLTYLFLWVAGFMAMLTISAGKREHYLLPVIPGLSLLMGFVADDVLRSHRWISARFGRHLMNAYGVFLILVPLGILAGWGMGLMGVGRLKFLAGCRMRWIHMLIVAGVALIPGTIALILSIRRHLQKAMVLVLISITIIYVGYHFRGDLWDLRRPAADFARQAAKIVPPDRPVGNWSDAQAKTVYYFGRNIPNLYWKWGHLVAQHGEQLGQTRWEQWVSDPRNVEWMFSYGKHLDKIRPLGFEVRLQVRGKQRKKHLFTLLRNTAATGGDVPSGQSRPCDKENAGI